MEKMNWDVFELCMVWPFSRVSIFKRSTAPTASAVASQGPKGAKASNDLPNVHCPADL